MAKVAPGVVNPLGVLDGRVYYYLNGKLVSRALPKAGNKKDEPAFKKQHSRTGILNGFAKGVNDAVNCYDYGLKSNKFYSNILKRFRREANNNRLLLLSELPGLEVNNEYSLESYGTRPEIIIRDQHDLIVELKACYHPRPPSRVKFDCYYFEVILLWWKGSDKICDHISIKTEWVQKRDTLPEFDVKFPIHKSATDYLIVLGQHLGKRFSNWVRKHETN